MSNIKNIVENIIDNNLVDAKSQLKQELLKRLGSVLEEQIEAIAPSMISEEEKEKEEKEEKKEMSSGEYQRRKNKNKNKDINDSYEREENDSDELNEDFEFFVDQIQEIVEEIEAETGEDLTEEEIIDLSKNYLDILKELDEEDAIAEEKLLGNQSKLDLAKPKGKLTGKDFAMLRKQRKNK
jgi:hypothetical protein